MAFNRRYIVKKSCKHLECERMPEIGCGGYCYQHRKEDPGYERKEAKAVLKKEEPKILMLSNSKMPDNKFVQNNAASEFQLLQNWFWMVGKEIAKKPYCWNCNVFIPEKYYRHASCHIMPKSIFKSVAYHPLNFLILGAGCGCHSRFDFSIESASKMPVWGIAVERFNEFKFEILEKHKYLSLFKEKIW